MIYWLGTSLTPQSDKVVKNDSVPVASTVPKYQPPSTKDEEPSNSTEPMLSLRTDKLPNGHYSLVLQNSSSRTVKSVTVELHDFTGIYGRGEQRESIDTVTFDNVGKSFEEVLNTYSHYIGKIERSNVYGNILGATYE